MPASKEQTNVCIRTDKKLVNRRWNNCLQASFVIVICCICLLATVLGCLMFLVASSRRLRTFQPSQRAGGAAASASSCEFAGRPFRSECWNQSEATGTCKRS